MSFDRICHSGLMARWSALTDHLNTADDTCVLTWDELEAMVGDLPPSASHYRAWWHGDRPQVRAWQAAGFRLADVSLGRSVTFARQTSARPTASTPPADLKFEMPGRLEVEIEAATTASDVVLISCSKTKLDHPAAARDLYDSPLFRQSRAYAVASGGPWFILSAEHGLVGPDEWLAPYERYLPDTPRSFRDAWGHWVVERLDLLVGGLAGRTVEIHAGAAYVEPIADRLRAKGCDLSLPLDGLSLGARQHWYAARADAAPEPQDPVDAATDAPSSHDQSAAAFAAILRDEAKALPPAEFLARGSAGLKVPGLYSWWADEQAATDLSVGLGHTGRAGHDLRRPRGRHALAQRQAIHQHPLVADRWDAPRQAP